MELSSKSSMRRLSVIAQHLRDYKRRNSSYDQMEEQKIQETSGKVISQVGFHESASPSVRYAKTFTPEKAAVLVCLFEGDDGELRVILTKRASRLSTHSGEVSLPGGKAEEGDEGDRETATREAKEEIGLDSSLVDVVTVLEPFLSKYLLRVVPVIGILHNRKAFKPTPNPGEVEEVFDAPLEMFLKDENRRVEEKEWMGEKYQMHYFNYEHKNKRYLIWGITAAILVRAASVVYQKPPAFEEGNPKFEFPKDVNKDTFLS